MQPTALTGGLPCPNQSDKKFALVIGNSYAGELSGARDARAVAEALCKLGYSVLDPVYEGTLQTIPPALQRLWDRIAHAESVVFYYSGHGYQLNGKNYLLPVGSAIDPADPQMPLDAILRTLSGAPREAAKVVFLDACRSNANLPVVGGGHLGDIAGGSTGLAMPPESTPPRTLFGYAADFGQSAISGSSTELSWYTAALLRAILEPGLEVRDLLARVHDDVFASTSWQQSPTEAKLAEFGASFYFRDPVRIQTVIDQADDDLFVVLNGKIVRSSQRDQIAAAPPPDPPLALAAGGNDLSLLLYSRKSFHNAQSWETTEGWSYALRLLTEDGAEIRCQAGGQDVPCFQAREESPFKDGPHHGQLFEVARAVLYVDPVSAELSLRDRDADVWNEEAPFWARDQDLLFEKLAKDLPLGEILGLGSFDVVGALEQLLGQLAVFLGPIQLPDLNRTFVTVRGNRAFAEAVRVCMVDQQADRIVDLKASIAAALKRDPTPFESFDRSLSASVWREVSKDPANRLTADDVRVWTALEDRSSAPQAAAAPRELVAAAAPQEVATAAAAGPVPAAAAAASGEAPAGDDRLVQRAGELVLGPFAKDQVVAGVPLSLQISPFLSLQIDPDQVRIAARIVVDLADLQQKIGPLVDTIPLPTDNCNHFGVDNIVARIWGKQLTVDGDVATLTLHGDVDVWTCAKNPVPCTRIDWEENQVPLIGTVRVPHLVTWDCNPPIKNRNLNQPFTATLPFRVALADPRSVTIELGDPAVDLGGALGGVTEKVLQIAGVDVSSRVKEALGQAIPPDLFRLSLPDDLLHLDPTITRAELLSHAGALAGYCEMSIPLGGQTLVSLLRALQALFAPPA